MRKRVGPRLPTPRLTSGQTPFSSDQCTLVHRLLARLVAVATGDPQLPDQAESGERQCRQCAETDDAIFVLTSMDHIRVASAMFTGKGGFVLLGDVRSDNMDDDNMHTLNADGTDTHGAESLNISRVVDKYFPGIADNMSTGVAGVSASKVDMDNLHDDTTACNVPAANASAFHDFKALRELMLATSPPCRRGYDRCYPCQGVNILCRVSSLAGYREPLRRLARTLCCYANSGLGEGDRMLTVTTVMVFTQRLYVYRACSTC